MALPLRLEEVFSSLDIRGDRARGEHLPEVEACVWKPGTDAAGTGNPNGTFIVVADAALWSSTGNPAPVERLRVSSRDRPCGPEEGSMFEMFVLRKKRCILFD